MEPPLQVVEGGPMKKQVWCRTPPKKVGELVRLWETRRPNPRLWMALCRVEAIDLPAQRFEFRVLVLGSSQVVPVGRSFWWDWDRDCERLREIDDGRD